MPPCMQRDNMATWKKKDTDGHVHYQFLCESCNTKKQTFLEQDNWTLVRETEPASCNDCELKCALTTSGLWDADDQVRYAVCDKCQNYGDCRLKGRYYC